MFTRLDEGEKYFVISESERGYAVRWAPTMRVIRRFMVLESGWKQGPEELRRECLLRARLYARELERIWGVCRMPIIADVNKVILMPKKGD